MAGWETTASRSMVAGIFAIRTRREPACRGKFPVHRKTWSRATHLPATRKKARRIAFANDRLPCLKANLSSVERHARGEASSCAKSGTSKIVANAPSETADDWLDGGDSISSKRSVSSAMTARLATIALSGFIPLNPAHGQPHDEARFAGFRFDFDFTIFRSPTMHWLIVRPIPFPDPTPLVGKTARRCA